MRRHVPAIIAAALALSACATEAGLREVLDSYIGGSEDDLVAGLGAPDGAYTTDGGTKLLTYRRSRSGVIPGTAQTHCVGYSCYTYATPATPYTRACTVVFRLRAGTVESYRYEGNACGA